MRLLVAGGAGFIGSNYVRRRLDGHPDDTVRVLDKLTYAGRRENLDGLPEERWELVEADIADRDAVGRPSRAATRSSTSPPSRTSTARSRRPASSSRPTSTAPTCCWRLPATPAFATCRSRPTRSTATSSWAPRPRSLPLNPSSPYSASKAGGDLLVSAFARTYGAEALIIRASNNYGPRQHPEKLIPLCILNALAGDPLPVYGDGMQVRNWLYVDDCCAAVDAVLERGEPGQVYNVGGPDELSNLEVVRRILALTDRDDSLISYVTDRPGHDRRYSLSAARLEALGWERAGSLRRGHRAHRQLVPRERVLVGADPLRRVPGLLRAPVRQDPGGRPVSFRRLPTEIDGVVFIEPDVHGDERGFLVETYRAEAMKLVGIDVDFVQENHSRSSARVLRGLHLQRGQAKLVRCARGRIFDVAVDLRPDSPTYKRWEGYDLDDVEHRQLFIPDGFGHGFCVLSAEADVIYRLSSYYDPELESGIAWDDPEVAVHWPITDPLLSDRDRNAPSLADLAASGSGLGSG